MTRPHDILNYPIAMLSIAQPWWLPSIEGMSKLAATMIPIVVFSYWTLMFGLKLYDRFKAKRP